MSVPAAVERVRRATEQVGSGAAFSGRCEVFVRTCFGFPAKYASARRAWEATQRRHGAMSAPPGVPVFWDILSGVNVDNDHIALSVGGGFCISTSAGPGRTVAKVAIADLTARWQMRYRGWSEDYHGLLVHVPGAGQAIGAWPDADLPPITAHTAQSLAAWRRLMASIGLADGDLDLAMQRWLRRLGFYGEAFRLDGDFGRESVSALQRFLATKGLYRHTVDGDRGRHTVTAEIRYLNQQRQFL